MRLYVRLLIPLFRTVTALSEFGLGDEFLVVVYQHFDFVVVFLTLCALGIDKRTASLCCQFDIACGLLLRTVKPVFYGIAHRLKVCNQLFVVLHSEADLDILLFCLCRNRLESRLTEPCLHHCFYRLTKP